MKIITTLYLIFFIFTILNKFIKSNSKRANHSFIVESLYKEKHIDKRVNKVNVKTLNKNYIRFNTNLRNTTEYEKILDDYEEDEDAYFFKVRGINCNNSTCTYPSICQDENTCRCAEGTANFYLYNNISSILMTKYCQYKQKHQVVAFFLEFFLPGTGHLYAGKFYSGVSKFIIMICLFCIVGGNRKSDQGSSSCLILIFFIWYMVDILSYASNKYKDGNGVPLVSWN